MRKTTHTRTITETRLQFFYEDLCGALNLPLGTKLFFHVPGGGDWSNADLEVSADNPLIAITKEVTE